MASPGSVYSTDASPHVALAARRGIFVRSRIPKRGSRSSRCRSHPRVPRFFAVAASAAMDRRAQLVSLSSSPDLHAGFRERPLSLAADPLRLSAEGAEPDVATSDVLCRLVAACARAPSLCVRRRTARLSSGSSTLATVPGPGRRRPFRGDAVVSPGRLPSASISILRPSEVLRVPSYVRAEHLAPFSLEA
jgi:hypothetical protein